MPGTTPCRWPVCWRRARQLRCVFFFFKQKTAYEIFTRLEFRRVLFRSTTGIAILSIEVVGSRLWVGILDFILRWSGGIAFAIAVPNSIADPNHHRIRTSTTHDRLMVVVADGVSVSQRFEVWHIPIIDVVEAHGGGTLFIREGRKRLAIAAGSNTYLNPREKIVETATGIVCTSMVNVAINLLPHQIEAMHRASGIGIIGDTRSELERTIW